MLPRTKAIAFVLLVIVVLVTVSLNADPKKAPSLPEQVLLEIFGTLQEAVTSASQGVERLWTDYFHLTELRQENLKLKKDLAETRARVIALKEADLENRRLKKLLKFAEEHDHPFIGADVVAYNPESWFKSVTINRGSDAGIRSGMPVVSDEGVVGRIVEVSPRFSKVLLAIDYNSAIDAFVQRSRAQGILAGRSENVCVLRYVLKNEDVVVGDLITTSGMSGVFPRGLALGTVTKVNTAGQDIFSEIEVTPAVDFTRLEEVLVVLTEQPPF